MAEGKTGSPREIAENHDVVSKGRDGPIKYCGVCGLPEGHPQENCSSYKDRGVNPVNPGAAGAFEEKLPAKGLSGE